MSKLKDILDSQAGRSLSYIYIDNNNLYPNTENNKKIELHGVDGYYRIFYKNEMIFLLSIRKDNNYIKDDFLIIYRDGTLHELSFGNIKLIFKN